MNASADKSILEYFYYWEKEKADEVYLRQPFGDSYRDFTWKETGNQIRRIAAFLKAQNLPPKSNIGLVSKNCAEWIICDMAILMAGHVSVPFYPTLVGDQIKQVVSHSDSKFLFVGKLDTWADMKPGIPDNVTCISFPTYNPDPEHLQWDDLLEKHEPLTENYYPTLDELMTIIYTSGTTGNPKGVMVSFAAMAAVLYHSRDRSMLGLPDTRFFSYLPLCHIAERNLVEMFSFIAGGTIYFAESLESFAKNLQSASPTHFLAVPRIWTKFQLGILSKLTQKKLNTLLKIPILNSIVKKKIRSGLGLADAQLILTGAAPMPVSLVHWFAKLGITIQEAYGMTENLGAVSNMPKGQNKDNSVGKLYNEMEVHIDSDTGEILTRSPWNMMGYYKEPNLTAETLDSDGWIHTGDVGVIDSEKFLSITGRVKEMYKTSKGEYVAPAQIELGFADNHFIDQVCVVGQSLPQPMALVVLSEIALKESKETIEKNLKDQLSTLNPKLKSYEKIKKVIVMKETWDVENNKLTPSLKIKRNVIEKEFNDLFEPWYNSDGKVIWQ
ncbi:Long-chain acyl-CoA synthetase (AMP-forming) [Spirosomataceae bacterium TFI 002]|nr:Long-chain acyl-CoA synthetase (AMP-forming) [Spirosomataceae bacterium TFI 002]